MMEVIDDTYYESTSCVCEDDLVEKMEALSTNEDSDTRYRVVTRSKSSKSRKYWFQKTTSVTTPAKPDALNKIPNVCTYNANESISIMYQPSKNIEELFPVIPEHEIDDVHPEPRKRQRYTKKEVNKLWKQLEQIDGLDPQVYRADRYGNVVVREMRLETENSENAMMGSWVIGYIFPHERGGVSVLGNLQILQHEAENAKGSRIEQTILPYGLTVGISAVVAQRVTAGIQSYMGHNSVDAMVRQHIPPPPKLSEEERQSIRRSMFMRDIKGKNGLLVRQTSDGVSALSDERYATVAKVLEFTLGAHPELFDQSFDAIESFVTDRCPEEMRKSVPACKIKRFPNLDETRSVVDCYRMANVGFMKDVKSAKTESDDKMKNSKLESDEEFQENPLNEKEDDVSSESEEIEESDESEESESDEEYEDDEFCAQCNTELPYHCKKCGKCEKVKYCSNKCAISAWVIHKHSCKK